MTTHPASPLAAAVARALHESCSRQDIDGYLAAKIDCKVLAQAAVAALASEEASQVPADGWRPLFDADREVATIQTFGEIVLRNSHPAWVRDEDGRTYEAVWTIDDNGRGYWWDIEAENPASPVEIYPHPLSAAPDQEGPADGK